MVFVLTQAVVIADSGGVASADSGGVASADDGGSAPVRTKNNVRNGADIAGAAEKMYYSGELYIFADSMIKINYEMASIAAELKSALQNGSFVKNASGLIALTKKYNAVSDRFNSWVDVKADLEYFIDVIGPRNSTTKSQLQLTFNRTLETMDAAYGMLSAAGAYYAERDNETKNALMGEADALVAGASDTADALSAIAQRAIANYRAMFDIFALQAGIELEYRTWQLPEPWEYPDN